MTSIKQEYASIAVKEFGASELYKKLGGASIQSDVDWVLIQTTKYWFKIQDVAEGTLAVLKEKDQGTWKTVDRKTYIRSTAGVKSIFEQAYFELLSCE